MAGRKKIENGAEALMALGGSENVNGTDSNGSNTTGTGTGNTTGTGTGASVGSPGGSKAGSTGSGEGSGTGSSGGDKRGTGTGGSDAGNPGGGEIGTSGDKLSGAGGPGFHGGAAGSPGSGSTENRDSDDRDTGRSRGSGTGSGTGTGTGTTEPGGLAGPHIGRVEVIEPLPVSPPVVPAAVPPASKAASNRGGGSTVRSGAKQAQALTLAGTDLVELSGSLWELLGTFLGIVVHPSLKLSDDEILTLAVPTEKVLKKLPKMAAFEKYGDELALIIAVVIVFGPKWAEIEKRNKLQEQKTNGRVARQADTEEYRAPVGSTGDGFPVYGSARS